MARTLVTGNILRSGSIPTTALGGGVVTSSLQIIASLPTGALSSSTQVNYPDISNIPSGIASSSAQVTAYLPANTVSSSAQVTTFLPSGTVSSSTQLPSGIASSSAQVTAYLPTDTVSSSAQVTAFLPTGTVSSSTQLPSGIASSSAQVIAYLPTGTVSSSTQVDVFTTIGGNTLATTGSNTFTAAQTISDTTNSTSYLDGALHVAGGMSVRKDVRISGSMTINGLLTAVSMSTQYVTSSQYNIGVSRITLNDDDNVRFAGMSILDSGSASPTSASIYWDSLKHKFIYENLSGSSYNSAIFIAGPKHTGSLGDESGLTTGYIPVATGDDHIDNSVIFQSGSNIGIGTTNAREKLEVNGNLQFTGGGNKILSDFSSGGTTRLNEFELYNSSDGGMNLSVRHSSAGGITLNTATIPRLTVAYGGNVGIGITNPSTALHVSGSSPQVTISGTASGGNRGISFVDGNAAKYNFFVGAQNNVNNAFEITPSTAAGGTTYSTPAILVNSSGNVGIGTTVTDAALEISKAITFTSIDTFPQLLIKASGGSTGRRLNLAVDDANNIAFIQAVNRGTDTINLSLQRYGGNVGIGTTNPSSATLQVNGKFNVTSTTGDIAYIGSTFATAPTVGRILHLRDDKATTLVDSFISIGWTSSPGQDAYAGKRTTANAGYFAIQNSSANEIFTIDLANQRVGIGSTNPSYPLDVRGSVGGYAASIGGATYQLRIYTDTAQAQINDGLGQYIQFRSDSTYMAFATNGSERLRIDAAGNVYTSVGSPISYGEGETYTIWSSEPEATAVSNDANWKNMKTFICSKSGTLKFKFSAYISSGTYYWAWRILKNGATVVASGHYNSGLDVGQTTSVHAYRRFVATVGPIAAGDSLVLQMISADGGGNATTGNGQTLYAKEFRAYSSVPSVEHGGSSNIWGERVGIGTTNPGVRLHVVDADNANSGTILLGGTTYGATLAKKSLTSGDLEINSFHAGAGAIRFQSNGTETVTFAGSGNVGIGTTNPVWKLDIRGTGPLALTGGGTTKQHLVNSKAAASSGTATKLWYVGHTHAVRIYLYIFQNTPDVATAVCDFTTAYGASAGGVVYSSRLGNISSISVAYDNGGSPAYTINVTVNYTGAAPTIYTTIEGISNDAMYLV